MRPSVKKLLLFGSVAPYSGALLALDFVGSRTNGKPYYMLGGVNYPSVSGVPGWTYTGGTAAGTGSYAARQDGSLQFFPSYTNLLLRSQEFGTTWATLNAAITSDAAVAPNGTTTADRLADDTTNGEHYVLQTATISPSSVYTLSVYAKQGTARYIRIGFFSAFNAVGSDARSAIYDLQAGNVSRAPTAGANGSATIALVGSYYRLTMTATSGSSATTAPSFVAMVDADGTTISYAGTGKYHDIWGAQLELGSTASTYIPTTTAAVTVGTPRITDAGYWAEEARTNLLLRSQEFDNASWVKTGATVTADQTTAPDGTLTADMVTENTATSSHAVYGNNFSRSAIAYALSIYIKGGTRRYVSVRGEDTVGAALGYAWITLDTQTGSIAANAGVTSSSATSVGNGWWRVSIVYTSVAGGGGNVVFAGSDVSTAPGLTTTTGNSYLGTSGTFYIWQADLQAGSFATSPIPTTSVAVTRAADVGYVSGIAIPTTGTMVATANVPATTKDQYLGFASDGSLSNRIFVNAQATNGNGASGVFASGVGSTITTSAAIAGAARTVAMAYTAGAQGAAANGGSVATATVATVPSVTRLDIGGAGTAQSDRQAQGPIRRIVIYPRAFGNAELQAITTAGAY